MWETVHLGRDNSIDLLFMIDGNVSDISGSERVTIEFGDATIDSDTSSDAFDWSDGEDGILYLTLGEESIPVGYYDAFVTIYDAENVNGWVWDSFKCRVVEQ